MAISTIDFGRDTSCQTSLKTGRFVSGNRLVAEAIFRRLTTPTGTLRGGEEEQNYGIDLLSLIGVIEPERLAATLPARIRTEVLKDERVQDCKVSVTLSLEGPAHSFDIILQITTALGPFDLRLAVDEVTVELVGLTA